MALFLATGLGGRSDSSGKAAGKPKAPDRGKRVAHPKPVSLQVEPDRCVLRGRWAAQALVVTGKLPDNTGWDLTGEAKFTSANPKVAVVGAEGVVRPVADGQTTIGVAAGGVRAQVQVSVKDMKDEALAFGQDVVPEFTYLGCNQAACHGARRGKGGFKLSLLGGEPDEDYAALTKSAAGRRINKVEPAKSLLVLAATGNVHGKKLGVGSPEYNLLVAWVAQGAQRGDEQARRLEALKLSADELLLRQGESRRILAKGLLSDGSEKDLTLQSQFKSTDTNVATVDVQGRIQAAGPGECTISVAAARRFAAARVIVPQPLGTPFPQAPTNNTIDALVLAKLKRLGILPSDLCADAQFLRRIYLDSLGILPTREEARAFLADQSPQKRSKLIETLFEREEFADFWAMKWGDVLRLKSEYPVRLWPKGVTTYYRWLRESIAKNKPYDQFARELLTATGSNFRCGPANFVRGVSAKDPQTIAETSALIFMGARIGCARCHAHPAESWSPRDNLGLGAFFAKVGYKSTMEWKEEIVFFNPKGALHDPRTREIAKPRFLNGEVAEFAPDEDPRGKFADWLISPGNPWFNRAIVNRVWFWLMGRGIIHEPDDLRSTNLPENPALLDYLAEQLVSHHYDLRQIFRLILNSRIYQLSSTPNESNKNDTAHFSHYYLKRMTAEEVVDALCQVTEVPESYSSAIPEPYTRLPPDYRAVQVFDGNIQTGVLELFGRPARDTPYACERNSEPSLRQELYLVNSDQLEGKVEGSPRLKRLLQDKNKTDAEILDEFYLSILSRLPTDGEKQQALAYLGKEPKNRAQAVQDIVWALLNTKEFLFIR